MGKFLYLSALFAGLILCIGLLPPSVSISVVPHNPIDMCNGVDEYKDPNADKFISGGVPLVFTIKRVVDDPSCDKVGVIEESSEKLVKDYASTWQFYVNWAIWSLPFLGVAYLYTKKHENTRH